jgi:surfactin synthase thioesterase subunit
MKIFIFPFAGGNKYSFNSLFQGQIDTTTLEYPGRGLRINEDLITNINILIENLYSQIQNDIISSDEYIIYGHSMGALVGYLICKKIEESGLKKPLKLVVSGKKPPKYLKKKILSDLPNRDFWNDVSKLGGIPEEINNHPELIEYLTPILKADFKCIEGYRHQNSPRLIIPIDVFYGSDEDINQEEANAWNEETTGSVNIIQLKGNHFFIFEHKDFFIEYFKNIQVNATI